MNSPDSSPKNFDNQAPMFSAEKIRRLNNIRVCFFGDSLVNGTCDPEFVGWPGRLLQRAYRRGHRATLYNLGIRGDTSLLIEERWERSVNERIGETHECRLVFSYGTNDCIVWDEAGRAPFEDSLKCTERLLAKAAASCPTIFIGPAPIDDEDVNNRTRELSSSLAEVCAKVSVPYLPVFETLEFSDLWWREIRHFDGAHPGAQGYALLADLVNEWSAWRRWFA